MSEPALSDSPGEPILHVFVIGFHHKKGCVVEFAYPPLSEENVNSTDLPDPWKHLPTLALPDGAHNFEKDTIYFHLPSLENPRQTVFGISCYRQMNAQNLLRRSSDITRGTVQKSVCVLSQLPLFGLIQAKLELITHAYFDERDFSKVSLLEETYKHLNSSLSKDLLDGQQAFLGLSVRELVLRFKHKTLLLFKLLLLERKVLFYRAPVKDLCSTILTLCSLLPGTVEKGLQEAATSVTSRVSLELITNDEHDYMEIGFTENNNELCTGSNECITNQYSTGDCNDNVSNSAENSVPVKSENGLNNNFIPASQFSSAVSKKNESDNNVTGGISPSAVSDKTSDYLTNKAQGLCDSELSSKGTSQSSITEGDSWGKVNHIAPEEASIAASNTSSSDVEPKLDVLTLNDEDKLLHEIDELLGVDDIGKNLVYSSSEFQDDSGAESGSTDVQYSKNSSPINKDESLSTVSSLRGSKSSVLSSTSVRTADSLETRRWSESHTQNQMKEEETSVLTNVAKVSAIESDECGLPLSIFTKGMLCHPYLSLPFLDVLSDVNVRGFLVGATNILFKQKKQLFDVVVEVEDAKVDIVDSELRRQLSLTTEDLRFADHLVRHVMEDKKDVFLDGTGWEGGDEWLRAQFKLYLLSIMRTSQMEVGGRENESFNVSFMVAWKATHNYKMWSSGNHLGILEINPGHPFQGQLSMADMKLKFSQYGYFTLFF